jgi:hypothetical protein
VVSLEACLADAVTDSLARSVVMDAVVAGVVFGTAFRAIGRGFGSGILSFAGCVSARADSVSPVASTNVKASVETVVKTVETAVDRRRGARAIADTAFLRGESLNRLRVRCIRLKMPTKLQMRPGLPTPLRPHRGKIAAKRLAERLGRAFRPILRPVMTGHFSKRQNRQPACSEEFHGSQDEFPGFFHCLDHAVQEWLA